MIDLLVQSNCFTSLWITIYHSGFISKEIKLIEQREKDISICYVMCKIHPAVQDVIFIPLFSGEAIIQ